MYFVHLPAAKAVVKMKDVTLPAINTNFAVLMNQNTITGTGNDIQLLHDGSNSYFDGGDVGAFYIRGGSSGRGPLQLTGVLAGGTLEYTFSW